MGHLLVPILLLAACSSLAVEPGLGGPTTSSSLDPRLAMELARSILELALDELGRGTLEASMSVTSVL